VAKKIDWWLNREMGGLSRERGGKVREIGG
jgi:hypothetical protein